MISEEVSYFLDTLMMVSMAVFIWFQNLLYNRLLDDHKRMLRRLIELEKKEEKQ